jgi:hypothetical protein
MYILKGNHPICKRLDAKVKTWKEMIKLLEDWTDNGYEVTIEKQNKMRSLGIKIGKGKEKKN